MTTKMKGLLKGLRYISQIFDEEKEPEMQIGFPTDVKHVAHIGWDGPSVDSPSWMKEYKSPTGCQSAPLAGPGDPRDDPEIKWLSEDSKSGRGTNSSPRDLPELPKSSRRHSSTEGSIGSPGKDSSNKSRSSRRHQRHPSKDSSDSVKSNRQLHDSGQGSESSPRSHPEIPKKSRRKKSKESVNGESTRSSRSRGTTSNGYTSPFSDPGFDQGSVTSRKDEFSQTSSMNPRISTEEKGSSEVP